MFYLVYNHLKLTISVFFVSLEWPPHIYIEGGLSSTVPAIARDDSTVAQKGQTKYPLQRGPFAFLHT